MFGGIPGPAGLGLCMSKIDGSPEFILTPVILSAADWVCIFVCCLDAQGATAGWVMPALVFKWFPLCEFSLFDTPQG